MLPTHTQSTALVWFGSTEIQSVNFELQSLKYKKVLQQNTAIFLRNVRKIGKKENRVKTQTFEEKKLKKNKKPLNKDRHEPNRKQQNRLNRRVRSTETK